MQKSIAPFVIICNEQGAPIASTATLHGAQPAPPLGACTTAKQSGEHTLSWQPEAQVRNAIVIMPWSINGISGYVIGGQSLKNAEQREAILIMQVAAGLLCTLLATFIITLLVHIALQRINKTNYA